MNEYGDAGQSHPRSARAEKLDGMNLGMRVLSYLISGVGFYGFLGWLGDHFLGTGFLLPLGIVLGAGLGCYVIIRRFGSVDEEGFDAAEPTPRQSGRVRGEAR
jgi:ATP synthase protein I